MITDRIKQIIDYKNINKSQFYKQTGLSNGFLDKVKDIGSSKIEQILISYPEISPNWLLTGRGDMFLENLNINRIINNRKTTDAVIDVQEVPFYDGLSATMGLKALFESGKPQQVLETIKIPNLPKCDGGIAVTGDSMYPLLKSGDIVLYKQTQIDSIFFGEMYLLSVNIDDWEEYITVKYVQKSDKGEDYVKLVSQNQHHQPRDIKKTQIAAIAMIKASIRYNTMF